MKQDLEGVPPNAETLPAGRDLDLYVHDWVMGGHQRMAEAADYDDFLELRARQIPEYSTDIEAAWLVVENLKTFEHPEEKAAVFTIWPAMGGACAAGWSWHEVEYSVVSAPTAPHAICLAALLAVGVKMRPQK